MILLNTLQHNNIMTYSIASHFFATITFQCFSDILFPLAEVYRPELKLAVDNNNMILEKYKSFLNAQFKELFSAWLTLMTANKDTSFSIIKVDFTSVPKEEYCLKLVSSIVGERTLIVDSIQEVGLNIDSQNQIEYEGKRIDVIDRYVARQKISSASGDTIISVINSNRVNIDNNSSNGR